MLKKPNVGRSFLFIFFFALGSGMPEAFSAPAQQAEAVAKVQIVKGQLQRISKIGATETLKVGSLIYASDTVRTSQDGGTKIQLLKDASVITLGPSTQIIASDMKKSSENPSTLDVSYGRVRSQISKSNAGKIKLILKTRSATMGVRGTEFETSVNPQTGTTSNVTFEGEVAMAKTPTQPPPISENQAKALNTTEKFATPPPTFNANQVAMVARAETAMEAQMKPERMTPEVRQAMAEIKKMAADPAAKTTGVTINETQAKAIALLEKESRALPPQAAPPAGGAPAGTAADSIQQLKFASQAVATTANPPTVSPEAAGAFKEMLALTQKNLGAQGTASLPPAEAQAMKALQALANRAESALAPVKPTPAELSAIAQIQRVAVQSTIVTAAAPTSEVFKTINDPDKTVSVNRGQYSGMNASQEHPTTPVKISPSQMESMRTTSPLAPPSAVTASNGQGAASAVPGKTISIIPPGLNAKSVSPTLAEAKEMMAKAGVVERIREPSKESATANKTSETAPPPEGAIDSKGRVAPPAGGFVDMKTGVYIPPPTGSAFDPVAGVYIPPPSMGTFKPETGAYVPPAGFVLDATKGFVAAPREIVGAAGGASGAGAKGPDGKPTGAPGGAAGPVGGSAGAPPADKPFGDPGKGPAGGALASGAPDGMPGIGQMLMKNELVIAEGAGLGRDFAPGVTGSGGFGNGGVTQNPFQTGPITTVLAFNPDNAPRGVGKELVTPGPPTKPTVVDILDKPPGPPTLGDCGGRPCKPPDVDNQCPPICSPLPPPTAGTTPPPGTSSSSNTAVTISIQ